MGCFPLLRAGDMECEVLTSLDNNETEPYGN